LEKFERQPLMALPINVAGDLTNEYQLGSLTH